MRINKCPNCEKFVCKKSGQFCEQTDCIIKDMALNMYRVALSQTCDRCDGVGYPECRDKDCGSWAAYEFLEVMDVEPQDGDWEKTKDPYVEQYKL